MSKNQEKGKELVRAYTIAAILIAALVGGWAIASAITSSPELLIHHVEVEGLQHLTENDVLAQAGLDKPTNVLNVNLQDVSHKLQENPWIRSVQLQKRGRDSLHIGIQEVTPRLIVATPTPMLADEQANIIDTLRAPYEHLPLLTGAMQSVSSDAEEDILSIEERKMHLLAAGDAVHAENHHQRQTIDQDVIREALALLDQWAIYDRAQQWPIREIGWDNAEGFSVVVGHQLEIMLGRQQLHQSISKAWRVLRAQDTHKNQWARLDVRAHRRAVLTYEPSGPQRQETVDESR